MKLQEELLSRLERECTKEEFQWLGKILSQGQRERKLGFVMSHRHISHKPTKAGTIQPDNVDYPIDLNQWTRDQLARTVILLSLDNGNQTEFQETIELLFDTADNREAQAIYASIPFFNYAYSWKHRATEAIRSNVGLIFEAMAFNNSYPAMYFDDAAWNQLVLKTIFNNKSIWNILGLEQRRNQGLADTISDFAHERWAADRTLPSEVWFLVAPFPGEHFWQDTYHLLTSGVEANKEAGYLLWQTNASRTPENFTEAFRDLFESFSKKDLSWKSLTQNSSS
ncbi:MAG TPA: EboA domain-containing protein [Membranihabitans sp.]|nr:EboA domain-containing protein [Membranihabitans sp.]